MPRLVAVEERSPAFVSGQTTPATACFGALEAASFLKLRFRVTHMFQTIKGLPGP